MDCRWLFQEPDPSSVKPSRCGQQGTLLQQLIISLLQAETWAGLDVKSSRSHSGLVKDEEQPPYLQTTFLRAPWEGLPASHPFLGQIRVHHIPYKQLEISNSEFQTWCSSF